MGIEGSMDGVVSAGGGSDLGAVEGEDPCMDGSGSEPSQKGTCSLSSNVVR